MMNGNLIGCWRLYIMFGAEISVREEKKKRLLREVAGLKHTQLQCKRSIHGWREYLQQLDARLAQQTANKESLERHNQHFQRQWQIHLEVRPLAALNNRVFKHRVYFMRVDCVHFSIAASAA